MLPFQELEEFLSKMLYCLIEYDNIFYKQRGILHSVNSRLISGTIKHFFFLEGTSGGHLL